MPDIAYKPSAENGLTLLKKIISLVLTPALLIGGIAGTSLVMDAPAAYAATNASEVDYAIQTILRQTNEFRATQGMVPLTSNASLDTVAQNWSVQQSDNGAMSHNPNYTTQYPAGWSSAGENVGYGYPVDQVVDAWINSPSHRANLLGNFTDLGIGFYYGADGVNYFTQNFAYYSTTKTAPGQQSAPLVTTVSNGIKAEFVPDRTGNSPITSYDLRAVPVNGGATLSYSTTASPYVLTGLEFGAEYAVSTRAVNAIGAGAWSASSNAFAPASAPSAATNLDIIPSLRSVDLTWNSKANGSTITSYSVTLDNVGVTTTTTPNATVNGLEPGTRYTGSITATNSVGTSPATNFAFDTPITVPDAPTELTSTLVGTNDVKVTWADGASDGGSSVTGYDVTLYNTADNSIAERITSSTMNHSFTNLGKGKSYYVTVGSNNGAGTSALARTDFSVPATVSSAPLAVKATLTDEQQITVLWNAPADDGGSAITGYAVSFYANGSSTPAFTSNVSPSSTSLVVNAIDGVNANTTYVAKVIAVNSVGNSTAASSSEVVVPRTPSAPDTATNMKLGTATLSALTATWNAPAYNGGSAITGYRVVLKDANNTVISDTVVAANTTSKTFSGLNRGTTYTASVTAVNDRGNSPVASATAETLIEAPSVANNVALTLESDSSIRGTWNAPTDNGGSAITGYRVELFANGNFVSSQKTVTPEIVFSELPFSTDYTIVVYATNKGFESAASATSNTVSTPTPPSAPASSNIAANGSRSVDVTWEAPASSGTYALAYFEVSLYKADGKLIESKLIDGSTLNTSFNTLMPGTTYFATVTSHSTITGGFSTTPEATTDAEIANAPESVNLSLDGSTAIKVNWTAPTYDGGAAVTGYNVTLKDSSNMVVDSALNVPQADIVFTGLDPASAYSATVTALNSAGESTPKSDSITTNAIAPTAPASVDASLGSDSKSVNATWEAPTSNGGATLTGYKAMLKSASGATVKTVTLNAATQAYSFADVAYGMTYHVDVVALNSIGASTATSSQAVSVPAVAPDAPSNVVTELNGPLTMVATWNAPAYNGGSTVTSYDVSIRKLNGDVVASQNVATLKASFANLNPATEYIVDVVAINIAGTSPVASSTKLATKAIAPSAATNTAAVTDGTTVNVTWEAPVSDGGDGNIVYVVVLKNAAGEVIATNQETNTASAFASLARGTSYVATVTAQNSGGKAPAAVSNSTEVAAIVADAPTQVDAVTVGEQSVKVTWAAPTYNGGATINGYKISVIQGDKTDIIDVPADATSFVIKDLTANSTYRFGVAAVNAVGESVVALVDGEFLTAPAVAPDVPTVEEIAASDTTEVTQTSNNLRVMLRGVAGVWAFAYSGKTPLGWALVGEDGIVNFNIANAGLEVGTHNLTVLGTVGNVIVSGEFAIAASFVPPAEILTDVKTSTDVKADNSKADNKTSTEAPDSLASTGAEGVTEGLAVGSGILALGVLIMGLGAFLRRRKIIEE